MYSRPPDVRAVIILNRSTEISLSQAIDEIRQIKYIILTAFELPRRVLYFAVLSLYIYCVSSTDV